MNSSFQLNQGESNSYTNKIEYSFEKSIESSSMTLIDCQKNMPFDYESDDGYFSHNEDRCDYYSEDDEDRDYEAEDYEAIIKKTDADIYTEANEKYYSQPKLQDPDKMTKILPARILPSVEEQEKEYYKQRYENNKEKKRELYQKNKELHQAKCSCNYYKKKNNIQKFQEKFPERYELLLKNDYFKDQNPLPSIVTSD